MPRPPVLFVFAPLNRYALLELCPQSLDADGRQISPKLRAKVKRRARPIAVVPEGKGLKTSTPWRPVKSTQAKGRAKVERGAEAHRQAWGARPSTRSARSRPSPRRTAH